MDINLTSQIFVCTDLASFPATGAAKTFYVADDTEKLYRWTGSAYVEVSAGSGGSSTWGGITGTLSDQTDLQTALNAKQDSLGYTAENSANKTDLMSGNTTSSTKYLSAKGVYDWAIATFQSIGTYLTSANITQTITNGVTDKAPSEDVLFDALALKQDKVTGVDDTEIGYLNGVTSAIQTQINNTLKYTATFRTSAANPADATTYFLGLLPAQAVALAENLRRSKFPVTGNIGDVCFTIQQTNNGSNETVTLKLRNITTATDYTVGTFTSDFGASTVVSFIFTGLTIPVGNTTDYWTFKIDPVTWASNPTGYVIAADCNVR